MTPLLSLLLMMKILLLMTMKILLLMLTMKMFFVVVLQQGCYLELAEDWMGCNGYTMKAQWAAQVRPIRNNDKNEKITRIDNE